MVSFKELLRGSYQMENHRSHPLSLDRRHPESTEVRRSICESRLAHNPEQVRQTGDSTNELALVDDPTQAKRNMDRITTPKKDAAVRGCSVFNPLARREASLGEFCSCGTKD